MELSELLQRIEIATAEEIDELLPAVMARKRILYPGWAIEYRAWEKGTPELPWDWPLAKPFPPDQTEGPGDFPGKQR